MASRDPGAPATRSRRPCLPSATREGGREQGSASVLVLALAGALAAFGSMLVLLGGAAVTRQRAASAADLASLAGADHALGGAASACAAAGRIARQNAVELTWCRLEGDEVTVRTRVRPRGLLGALGGVTATARAGPSHSAWPTPTREWPAPGARDGGKRSAEGTTTPLHASK